MNHDNFPTPPTQVGGSHSGLGGPARISAGDWGGLAQGLGSNSQYPTPRQEGLCTAVAAGVLRTHTASAIPL